jgi:hypothetical protein
LARAQAEPGLKVEGLLPAILTKGAPAYAFAYSFKVFNLLHEYL